MMRSSHIFAGVSAGVLLPLAFAAPAAAGMRQDLARCTAAKGQSSAAACTRVMNSGRLPDEQFYIGYFNRGSAYRTAADFKKALADFNRVVKLKPRFARGYHARGLVHQGLGAIDKARADFDRAIKLAPKHFAGYLSRAALLREREELDAALADAQKAEGLKPKHAPTRLLHALILSDKGEQAAARSVINKLIAEGHANAAAYYARATVAFRERRLDAATSDLGRALKRRPSFAAAHMLMGRVLEVRGDTAAAKASYRKALRMPADHLEGRSAHKTARRRLSALSGGGKADVALNNDRTREVGCKRFLPTTGTVISADCDE